jgi:hypothetical protein
LTVGGAGNAPGVNDETRIETRLYDADGNPTDDSGRAVRAEAVEVDAHGNVVRRLEEDGLSWQVDAKALAGDDFDAATRPRDDDQG